MAKRSLWRSKFGFYLVAIGSALGLGNLWRFPYVVAENGGGAFVLLYLTLALSLGLPLLVGELLFGKINRKSILAAIEKCDFRYHQLFQWVGRTSLLLAFVVLSYYAVISGWVLHFVMQFFSCFVRNVPIQPSAFLQTLMGNGLLQVALASVHILIAWLVVIKGVQEGLEKWIGKMMPLFVILLVIITIKSLSLNTSGEALRFIFYPDFSKLTYSSLISAIGHVLFTLSVGFGTMVTFGSYFNDTDHVPTAGFRVTMADSMISLSAGLLVFPMILHGASNEKLSDPTLLFEALPQLLVISRFGTFFGLVFFICLYIAALGASIGLYEVIVSNVVDRNPLVGRIKAAKWTGWGILAVATIPAFSSNILSRVQIGDRSLLEFLDSFLITWLLPLVALGLSLGLSRAISKDAMEKEFLSANHINSSALFGHWKFALNYFIPMLIVLGFILNIFGIFKS